MPSFWHSWTREYLTDTATNNIITLLQRNDGLTPVEAEAKIRREIKKAEDNYVAAAREVFDDPVLGKNERIRKLVLNIPYGMGGNVSVLCSPTQSTLNLLFLIVGLVVASCECLNVQNKIFSCTNSNIRRLSGTTLIPSTTLFLRSGST